MFTKLRQRWKVSGQQLLLILITFALGGSLCGYAGRKLLGLMQVEERWLWLLLYIIFIALLWPICVLLISIPLGQFSFFRKYVGRIGSKMFGGKSVLRQAQDDSREDGKSVLRQAQDDSREDGKTVIRQAQADRQGVGKRIAIFASGAGSNARKIIEYFAGTDTAIVLIICNKPGAGVLDIAKENNIKTLLVNKENFFSNKCCLQELAAADVDLLVLAGFLWKIPTALIQAYPGKIVNIHPALLPKFGGKGMYGAHVHEAVIAAGEKESGITIHYVDELYDHGQVIFQATCSVDENDTPATLAGKIHQLEHEHYPRVIGEMLQKLR